MKKVVVVIIISFLSGIGGSFFYEKVLNPQETSQDYKNAVLASDAQAQKSFTKYDNPKMPKNPEGAGIEEKRNLANAPFNEYFVRATKMSAPSVVYIKTVSQTSYGSTWMDWFFGDQAAQSISSGSGVIYSSDGYIVTNNHVVQDADQIQVVINKKPYDAKLIGNDPSTDLAVLKIDADDLPPITMGSSSDLQVGEWVLAVGNPFNLNSTVTSGIVSAKGRELNIVESNFPIESFIQTDAAINPGNSGGALVNMDGELVGINSAILSKTGSYAGYGFAVPSDIVKKVVGDIIHFGMVQKAFIGADVLDIDASIAKKLHIDDYSGVVVSYVQQDGAAAKAGLERGDVITKMDNRPVNSRSAYEELLSYHSPGDQISVEFRKDGKTESKTITLTNNEGTTDLLKKNVFTSRTLGADFETVPKVERDLLNIDHGVQVVKVRNGFIRQMNIPEGFIFTYINKIPIKDPESLTDILNKIRGRVLVEGVDKGGRKQYYRYYF